MSLEILCKLYLELANVVPKDCVSSRELAALPNEEWIQEAMRLADEYADDTIGHLVNSVSRAALEAHLRSKG